MEAITRLFAGEIRNLLQKTRLEEETIQEIRLRVNAPLMVICQGEERMIARDGDFCSELPKAFITSQHHIRETVDYLLDYSLYAYEEELRQGYFTVPGGFRVGIAGKIVMEGDKIRRFSHITFLNIRFSHQIKGCASAILPYIVTPERICHTLIISPPGGGKTTLLRDMIRQLSDGCVSRRGYRVGVVDERSEIGGCYQGIPQNDLGIRTDVLDGCPKAEGMMMLVRAMAPDVIAVDEIGSESDIHAIEMAIRCGCRLLATVHGLSYDELKQKPVLKRLLNAGIFERYLVLTSKKEAGQVQQILDGDGSCLFENGVSG